MNPRQTAPQVPSLRVPDPDISGLLASSLPAFLSGLLLTQNTSIIRTKHAHKRECDICKYSAADTYNCIAVKCPHLQVPAPGPALNLNLSLNPNLGVPFLLCTSVVNQSSPPKLTKTDRFRPILPGTYYTNKRFFFPASNPFSAPRGLCDSALNPPSPLDPRPVICHLDLLWGLVIGA